MFYPLTDPSEFKYNRNDIVFCQNTIFFFHIFISHGPEQFEDLKNKSLIYQYFDFKLLL